MTLNNINGYLPLKKKKIKRKKKYMWLTFSSLNE